MSWASRRRAAYIGTVVIAVALLVGIPTFRALYSPPTCFDGEQNGGETGVDCGGACERVCDFESAEPAVVWSRLFTVVPGVYAIAARVGNPNANARATGVPYVFSLRDARGILVNEITGATNIPPRGEFVIFKSGITTGERAPRSVQFAFASPPEWRTVSEEAPHVGVADIQLTNETAAPRVSARIVNDSLSDREDIEVIAVAYAQNGNAVAASRTVIDFLPAGASAPVVFTWSAPFEAPVARVEVLPQLL